MGTKRKGTLFRVRRNVRRWQKLESSAPDTTARSVPRSDFLHLQLSLSCYLSLLLFLSYSLACSLALSPFRAKRGRSEMAPSMSTPVFLLVSLLLSCLVSFSMCSISADAPAGAVFPTKDAILWKNASHTAESASPESSSQWSNSSHTVLLSDSAAVSGTAASGNIYNKNLSASDFGQCDDTCFKNEKNTGLSCAFVSPAGSLLSAKMGRTIDKNDIVIRTGFAPIDGYESSVGSRTTARFTWTNASNPLLVSSGNERFIFILQYDLNNNTQCRDMLAFYRKGRGSNLSLRCFLVSVDVSKVVYHTGWASDAFSSGVWSLAILAQACDSVTAYGVRFTPDSAHNPYHYYENRNKTEAEAKTDFPNDPNRHKFFEESQLYRDNSKCLCYAGAAATIFFDVKKFAQPTGWIFFRAYDEKTGLYGSSADGLGAVRAAFRAAKLE